MDKISSLESANKTSQNSVPDINIKDQKSLNKFLNFFIDSKKLQKRLKKYWRIRFLKIMKKNHGNMKLILIYIFKNQTKVLWEDKNAFITRTLSKHIVDNEIGEEKIYKAVRM